MSAVAALPAPLPFTRIERAARRRAGFVLVCLLLLVLAALVVSLAAGTFWIGFDRVVAALTGNGTVFEQRVVFEFRLPRVILALCVGSGLAVAGTLLQAVTRNPLASPEVVGVTGGAGLAALIIVSYVSTTAVVWAAPAAAFVGAAAAGGVVYLLSRSDGILNPGRLALIGVAVGGLATAGIQLVLVFTVYHGDPQLALRWLIGSLWSRSWTNVEQLAPFSVTLLPVAWLISGQLDLLGLGDDVPRALGSRLELLKACVLALALMLAGSAVAVAGTIAFVGLLAPHMCRRLVGPQHVLLVPGAALIGALLLLVADLLGRLVLSPLELPAGLFTALLGAPYFLIQLRRGLGRA